MDTLIGRAGSQLALLPGPALYIDSQPAGGQGKAPEWISPIFCSIPLPAESFTYLVLTFMIQRKKDQCRQQEESDLSKISFVMNISEQCELFGEIWGKELLIEMF